MIPLAWTDQGTGLPLVLLHGFGSHRAVWDPWIPALGARHRVVNVDLPGFGAAPTRAACTTPRQMAGAVADLLEHLDLRDVTLVGHSLGGGVALLMALDELDAATRRIARLVSVAGAAYPQRHPPFVRLAHHPLARVAFDVVPKRWLIRTVMRQIVVDDGAVRPERVEVFARPLRSGPTRRAVLECAKHVIPRDLDELARLYPRIDVPTLCLWGRQDPVVPLAVGERLARELPHGRLRVIERCGHMPMDERPDEALDVLTGFLDETRPGVSAL